uniref:NADH dehydrogenase subunit 2 n=1 Tax=Amegilla calceifera TaxID=597987 RepID=A0A7U0M8A7_9HYME|nr:NADH dehydrogenase subunit 2 [Amegilla calceifera]QQX27999.1 NADH dehydrogenase subunit 2 [Amegilla calceifera]
MGNKLFLMMLKLMNIILLLLMMTMSDIFKSWLVFEIASLILIGILSLSSSDFYGGLIYFVISSYCMVYMFWVILLGFTFSEYEGIMKMMAIFVFFLKLGVFPFHYWMVSVVQQLSWSNFYFLSTVMKLLYMIFFLKLGMYSDYIYFFFLMNLLGMMILMKSYFNSIKVYMYCTGSGHVSLMMGLGVMNLNYMLYYCMMYFTVLFLVIFMFKLYNLSYFSEMYFLNLSNFSRFMFILVMLIYTMMPPFMSLMLKWFFMEKLINNYTVEVGSLLWLFSISIFMILGIWNYLSFLILIFFGYNDIFKLGFTKLPVFSILFLVLMLFWVMSVWMINVI